MGGQRQRIIRAALAATTVLVGLGAQPMPSRAQSPFGWVFGDGGPRPGARSSRPRRRLAAAPHLVEAPRLVDVPLPVPRPHFPGDPPHAASVAAAPPAPPPAQATEKGQAASLRTGPVAPAESQTGPRAEPAKPAVGTTPAAPAGDAAASNPFVAPAAPASPPAPVAAAPVHVDVPPPPGPVAPVPPVKPPGLGPAEGAKPPAAIGAKVAPSGARLGEAPGQPDDDTACPARLKARGVDLEQVAIGPQPDPRCTVVEAARLQGLTLQDGGKVAFPDRPTIACTTADAFSSYVRDLLSPLAKGTFGAPVGAVWTGPGLECRSRDHIFGAKLSAHGQGLAVDIAQIKLGDGRVIEVGTPTSEVGTSFETAARNAACGYFHTTLGPGSDSYHRNHWHFDLEVRGAQGDSKYCK